MIKTYEQLRQQVLELKIKHITEWETSKSLLDFAHTGPGWELVRDFARENILAIRQHWGENGPVDGFPNLWLLASLDVTGDDRQVMNKFSILFSRDIADALKTWLLSRSKEQDNE